MYELWELHSLLVVVELKMWVVVDAAVAVVQDSQYLFLCVCLHLTMIVLQLLLLWTFSVEAEMYLAAVCEPSTCGTSSMSLVLVERFLPLQIVPSYSASC